MHKRALIASSTALAALTATAVLGGAQAGSAHNRGHDGDGRTSTQITVIERATSDKVVDNKPKGDSIGDLLAFGNAVYDETNKQQVGRDQGSCIRTVVGKSWECSWTTVLAKGSLVVQGPFNDTGTSVLAITGGTGAYSRASGEMRLEALNKKGTAFKFTFYVEY